MTTTRSALRRVAAGVGALGAVAIIVTAATASYADDDPPPFKTGTVPGAWITASPNPVFCANESKTVQIRLSWWTPARGLNDGPDRLFVNMVKIDGYEHGVKPWPRAGEEHSIMVPFKCDKESHTYSVSNPGGGGPISVTVGRKLPAIKERLEDSPRRTTVDNPGPSKEQITVSPCGVKPCFPEVETPVPAPEPGPGPGPGPVSKAPTVPEVTEVPTGPAPKTNSDVGDRFKTKLDDSPIRTRIEGPSTDVIR